MKSLSREASISNLRRFFGDSGAWSIAIDDLFKNSERQSNTHDRNMSWLFNKLSMMGEHGLFEKKYTVRGGVRVLSGLDLTRAGHEAVYGTSGQNTEPVSQRTGNNKVSLEDITQVAKVFMEQNPSWEIEITPRLKREEVAR